jgi:DNA-binding response OmpR family regulator
MDQKISFSFTPHAVEAIIVIIDEYKATGDALAVALEAEERYRAYAFSRVEEALHLGGSIIPDLFIIDYNLARMTGVELYHRLQVKRMERRIPCILLNAPTSILQDGYLWNIQKPFGLDTLLETVRRALHSAYV